MRLADILKTVAESTSEDWHRISCWGGGSGPSYRGRLDVNYQGGELRPGNWWLEQENHSNVGVYMPNAAITMAVGFTYRKDFKAKWANKFPDPSAQGCYADIFFNGALVFRLPYVVVDGGRAALPIPDTETLAVPRALASVIEIVEKVRGHDGEPEDYLEQADMKVIDAPWPIL